MNEAVKRIECSNWSVEHEWISVEIGRRVVWVRFDVLIVYDDGEELPDRGEFPFFGYPEDWTKVNVFVPDSGYHLVIVPDPVRLDAERLWARHWFAAHLAKVRFQ